ncbi:MAG TPA: FG-GAP repeat protein [Acidimicrobiales bacterium]|nr:FG-GAP repeat protein [Acidimicrobiales bacterium]
MFCQGFVALVLVGGTNLVSWPAVGAITAHPGTVPAVPAVPAVLAGKGGPRQLAELLAADGASGDGSGSSVSVVGGTMAVGAPFHTVDGNAQQGAVYVYVRSGSSWTQQAELTASDGAAFDAFGSGVALSKDTLVVGAPQHTVGANAEQGAAYLFTRTGTSWTQQAELTASDGAASDFFGYAISLTKKQLVVGAPLREVGGVPQAGGVYVFARGRTGWTQQAELTASDGAANDFFGEAVALSGTTLVVGAPHHQVGFDPLQGAAYVFTGGTSWVQSAELTAADGEIGDTFGWSVAVSGGEIIVGAPGRNMGNGGFEGAAYLFTGGTSWVQTAELAAPDGAAGDEFGASVAISGTTAAVGAPGHATFQGAAYVFTDVAGWAELAELTASDGAANDFFGWAVDATPRRVAVGAEGWQGSQGAAYLFAV